MNSILAFLQQEVINSHTPSIQYAYFDRNTLVYSYQYGCSDVSVGRLADANTTYNLFSITKTFTALAALQLADAGKLQLNDPIQKYLPLIPYTTALTIEQLLTHTAGLPNPLPLRWTHLFTEHEGFDRDLFFKSVFVKNSRLKLVPGTKFSYSNLGYVLLGQLIEKVTGHPYESYIKQNILDKAQIPRQDLDFSIDLNVHAKGCQKYWTLTNAILGFMVDKEKTMDARVGKWKPFKYFYVNGTPYGGMVGTVRGLVKYAQDLLTDPSPFISDAGKKLLFSENCIGGVPTGMGHAWFTGSLKGNKYIAHAGGGGGYYTELRLYPELGTGSVILNNRTGMKDERMLNKTDHFFLPKNKPDLPR